MAAWGRMGRCRPEATRSTAGHCGTTNVQRDKETMPMSRRARYFMVWVLALTLVACTLASAAPEGQLTMAVHFTLAPTLFEPAETPGLVTPFMFLYALHDALVKPTPDKSMAPSLAESWSASPDGLVYEFVLRQG